MHDSLKDFFAAKAARCVIQHKNKKLKIELIKLDRITKEEKKKKEIPIKTGEGEEIMSISIEDDGGKKKGLFESFGVYNFPSCDYLDIYLENGEKDPGRFYLIEETDFTSTLAKVINSIEDQPKDVTALIIKQIKEIEADCNATNENDFRELINQVISYKLVEESRRKFYSSMAILFYLQSEEELVELFPSSQEYNFVFIDVPGELGELNIAYRREIRRQLEDNILPKVKDQLKNKIEKSGARIKRNSREIKIGKFLFGLKELISMVRQDHHNIN